MNQNQLIIQKKVIQFLQNAWQYWGTQGWDESLSVWHEGMALNGHLDPHLTQRRFRVQCRQIYVFASAFLETNNQDYRLKATQAFESWDKYYRHPNGGWVNAIDASGKVIDYKRNAYEHAFAIFALSWLYRINADPMILEEMEKGWLFFDTQLKNLEFGGFENELPHSNAPRQQNPHMHLMEATLFAYDFTQKKEWLNRATLIFELFKNHFYDAQIGGIREFFSSDWSHLENVSDALEPGHFAEWIWLLDQYEKRSQTSTSTFQEKLYQNLIQFGINQQTGIGFDEINPQGQIIREKCRIWIPCETLKAHITMYNKRKDEIIKQRILILLQSLFDRFLNSEKGLWKEHLSPTGENYYSHIPASSLYHINLAFCEFLKTFN